MDKNNEIKVKKLMRIQDALEISQVQFADLLDMNKSYINRIFSEKVYVSKKFVEKVCEVFRVPLEYFDTDAAIDMPLDLKKYEPTPTEGYYSDPNIRVIHKLLDNLIEYRGKNNKEFLKSLSSMFNDIWAYLNFRDNYKDPDEGVEMSDSWLDDIINDIVGM